MRSFLKIPARLLLLSALIMTAACGDDDDDTLGPGDATVLTSGAAVTGLSGSAGNQKLYKIVVPSGATNLTVTTTGGTGDVDLYTRFNAVPTFTTNDCASEDITNDETCSTDTPSAGDWYILLDAFEAYSGVTLTATVTTP